MTTLKRQYQEGKGNQLPTTRDMSSISKL